jgi:hypothetical protein
LNLSSFLVKSTPFFESSRTVWYSVSDWVNVKYVGRPRFFFGSVTESELSEVWSEDSGGGSGVSSDIGMRVFEGMNTEYGGDHGRTREKMEGRE